MAHRNQMGQPHIFGANALHYRQCTAIANTETPPTWSPEMAHDANYPYTLKEYLKDVSRWMAATKVSAERRGPLLALAIGGAGRTVADDVPDDILAHGAVADLGDGYGSILHTGPKLLFHALGRKFPDNNEALMLRAGLEFFAFTPRSDESVQLVFLRFDTMLEKANALANLDISYPLRAWMVLALLRLPPKKWSEYLKDMGHRFPKTPDEYRTMQEAIIRERTLENQVGVLSSGSIGSQGGGGRGTYMTAGEPVGSQAAIMPLYLCLGNPAATATPSTYLGYPADKNHMNGENTVTLLSLDNIDDSDSEYSSDETWLAEDGEDPYDGERLEAELAYAKSDPMYLAELYWAKRLATRRYRAAKGKCGPRKRFHPRKIAKRFTRRGPGGKGGSTTQGFFMGEHFVCLDHVPEDAISAFFQGKSKGGGKGKFTGNRDQKCINCGHNAIPSWIQ